MSDEPQPKKQCFGIASDSELYTNVGIEEYLVKVAEDGFSGKIKERWEDFIVNEINLNKEIVHITTDELPKEEEINIVTSTELENKYLASTVIDELDIAFKSSEKKVVTFKAPEDKTERREIHNFIKSRFPSLFGNTVTKDGQLFFEVCNVSDKRSTIANKIKKKSGLSKYCQFVLYKEGMDTIGALNIIGRYLRVKPNGFTYAGTKDKRGITTQLVSIKGCSADRLQALNACLRNMHLGNFVYVDQPLKLGDLFGNKFQLVIRNVIESPERIASAVDRFRKGFINYFGLQRFGSTDNRSHEIGKLAFACKWEEMIKMILEPTTQDLPHVREAKEKFKENENYEEFLDLKFSGIESYLVDGLSKHGYTLNALDSLPRNLKQLYVHSYQSFIWNKIASRRIREFGNSDVLPGDLIEHGGEVHLVDESDAEKYSLADIVLPLPGFDIKLPNNAVAEWYCELLEKDGLTLNKLQHRVKDFSLPGAYRRLVVVPEDVHYRIHQYDDCAIPLLESDQHKMNGDFTMPESKGDLRAVIIEFNLPKSSYATIAIRELMRTVNVVQ